MNYIKGLKLIHRSRSFSLNLFSFFVLILADILLSMIIFHGLSEQIDQLTNEYEYFPYKYRQAVIQSTWVENNVIDKISDLVLATPTYREPKTHKQRHPFCNDLDSRIDQIKADKETVELFNTLKRLKTNYQTLDTYQKTKLNLADTTWKEIQETTRKLSNTPLVAETVTFIFKAQKENYSDDIKSYKRTFAFKRTGFGLMFLVPILGLLVFWNNRANQKDQNLSIIISSHFILVALLPILFEILRLILEFLPRVLLKQIYDFLISSRLVSIWYYILIALIVAGISVLIWFLQNKVFTQKRYLTNRIQKSRCTQCSLKISYDHEFCPNCGNTLLKACPFCSELTIDGYDHCQNCGKQVL